MPLKIKSDKEKIELIKEIYKQTLADINKIKKDRDEKIREVLKNIDDRQIAKVLEDIKK